MSYDIHALRAAGATYREIAEMTGLSQGSIGWRLGAALRAARAPAPTVRPRRKKTLALRPCLCCGKPFGSEGPHNRLCDPCRRKGGNPFDTDATFHY